MIYPYTNETQTRWDRGELRVQLVVPTNSRPIGFCDGTDADEVEIRSQAEEEGAEDFRIERRVLKTGREIWTMFSKVEEDRDGDIEEDRDEADEADRDGVD